MDDERALLAAIIAHPDEDTPRLMYADWLQEHDQPERAELIRAQVSLFRTKGISDFGSDRHHWNQRVRQLLQTHSVKWRKQLPRIARVSWGPFERGMIESATVRIWEWTPEVSAELSQLFGRIVPRILRINFYSWRGQRPNECEEMLRWGGIDQFEEVHMIGPAHLGLQTPTLLRIFTPACGHIRGANDRVCSTCVQLRSTTRRSVESSYRPHASRSWSFPEPPSASPCEAF